MSDRQQRRAVNILGPHEISIGILVPNKHEHVDPHLLVSLIHELFGKLGKIFVSIAG
jgi:hypothetical protein